MAEPRVHLGTHVKIDVATFATDDGAAQRSFDSDGGPATVLWEPALATLPVEADSLDLAEYEVRIDNAKRERQLVAAILWIT